MSSAPRNFTGDLLALVAGPVLRRLSDFRRTRADRGSSRFPCCCSRPSSRFRRWWSSASAWASAFWPTDWTPAADLRAVEPGARPGTAGLFDRQSFRRWWSASRLLTQPAVSALIGWFAYRRRSEHRPTASARWPSPSVLVLVRLARTGLAPARRASPVERDGRAVSPLEQLRRKLALGRGRECRVRRLDREGGRAAPPPSSASTRPRRGWRCPRPPPAMIDVYIAGGRPRARGDLPARRLSRR